MYLLCLDDHDALADKLCVGLNAKKLQLEHRLFPDGELYYNLETDVSNQDIIILCHLHKPNEKALNLWMMASHLKDMGAKSIGLVAPYLAYMRQDIRFKPGECLTSKYFAQLISEKFDYLITIDPHLHRYKSLNEIYSIPSKVLHATDTIAQYIAKLENPLVVGPDEESEQWAQQVAEKAQCDYIVLTKIRSGDRDVAIEVDDIQVYQQHTPVMVDDIISTGRTMLRTAEQLVKQGLQPPVCIGVHAVFSQDAIEEMQQGPIKDVITCNTIPHSSNQIDLSTLIVNGIKEMNHE